MKDVRGRDRVAALDQEAATAATGGWWSQGHALLMRRENVLHRLVQKTGL